MSARLHRSQVSRRNQVPPPRITLLKLTDATKRATVAEFTDYGNQRLFMRKSVIIIQDNRKLREEFECIVKSEADMHCVGSYASVGEALLQIGKDKPNVILMNIKLPGISGIACLNFSKTSASIVQTIIATTSGNAECIVQALTADINGPPAEPNFREQFTPNADSCGERMGASTVRMLLQHCCNVGTLSKATKELSPREQQVLDLLAAGLIYREIAVKLNIGGETVRSYVKQIRQKLHVRNRIEAIANYWQASHLANPTTERMNVRNKVCE